MIIIYNLSGLLIGLAGLALGILTFVASGWLSAGLLVLGATWLAFGRGRRDPETGLARPSPSLFFIPLFVLAIPILLLVFPAAFADMRRGQKALDPRSTQFEQDEKALNQTKLNGDKEIALAAYEALKVTSLDDQTRIFASTRGESVLVLAKIPSLNKLDKADREAMVKAVVAALGAHDAVKDRKLYLGIKGRIAYGAVHTPAGSEVGSFVSSDPLLNFYEPPAAAPVVKPEG